MSEFCPHWKVDNIAVRWGHSAVLYDSKMFVFAGVDGPNFSTEVCELTFQWDAFLKRRRFDFTRIPLNCRYTSITTRV